MIATRQIRTGDTVRLREGDLVRLGTVEEIHGEYAYIKREGETLITSAMIGTFETVDARMETEAVVSALRTVLALEVVN